MEPRDEPDPASWWERYGHRLSGDPVTADPAGEPVDPRPAPFEPDRLLRSRGPVPDRGWRRWLHAATLGRVDPGPSAAQLAEQDRLGKQSH